MTYFVSSAWTLNINSITSVIYHWIGAGGSLEVILVMAAREAEPRSDTGLSLSWKNLESGKSRNLYGPGNCPNIKSNSLLPILMVLLF